jgi:FAD/FMN-containing dehydrogenase
VVALACTRGAAAAAPDRRLRALAKTFRGQIVLPGSPLYERLRVPYNANYAGVHPLAIVRPVDAPDVARVVRWAAAEHVPIVARSGGHSYAGTSTTRGVVVDLAHLSAVHISGNRALVGPGARLGAIYAGLGAHGLGLPAGTCPSVGIGGHALGGGFGLASRAWGLASDNLLAVDVVTADGRTLRTDRSHHADLFWACRGGGGGTFGFATRFVFRTHRVATGSYFIATYPWAQVEEALAGFLAWAPATSAALGSICRLAAGGTPSVQVFGQFLGPQNELAALVGKLAPAPPKLVLGTASWLDLVARWAGCLGHSLPSCAAVAPLAFAGSSLYVGRVPSPAQLSRFRQAIEERGAASGALLVDAYGGAVNRVSVGATAFPHRHALASVQVFAPGGASARAWVTQTRAHLAGAGTGEAYVNYLDPTLPARAYFGPNLPRLVQVKRRYDPHDLFRPPLRLF